MTSPHGRRGADRGFCRPVHRTRDRTALAGITLGLLITLASCADFSAQAPPVTIQPSLSAAAMHPQDENPLLTTSQSVSSETESAVAPPDPCAAAPPIIAACLNAPWGLAVLPDGQSALVGERTTGQILQVGVGIAAPIPVAQITDLDSSGDGGLLGLALSPHFLEDGLFYAYVTSSTDNRILRIAPGEEPKPVFTGIPKGATHNGGRIEFGTDGYLYIAVGDTGVADAGTDPTTMAGKVLRLDESGAPAGQEVGPVVTSPSATSEGGASTDLPAIFASGLTAPTGLCVLPTGGIGVVDRVGTADVLLPVTADTDIATGVPVWTYEQVDGGAVDCAINDSVLGATSLDQKLVTALTLGPAGGFTGQPEQLAKDQYGRLLSLEGGTPGLLWATTSNKDGFGEPQPRDDLVVVIVAAGGGGDGGAD